jgi:hypothetical protein
MMLNPQISESMLVSCGIKNKFVLVQNVMVDQVSCEYNIIYVQDSIDVLICMGHAFIGCL